MKMAKRIESRAVFGMASLLSVGVLLCVMVAAANANATSFGSQGQRAGEFVEPKGITINRETGEVFVADRNNARVDVFDPEGAFLRTWGWGVANASESLQTCTSQCFNGYEGPGAGELFKPEGIAIDNDSLSMSYGDVYVRDVDNFRVEEFTPAGAFVLMFGSDVNATTHGNVCLAGEACQAGSEGTGPGQLEFTSGNAIAVGPNGTVYVGAIGRIEEFSSGGVLEGEVSLPSAGMVKEVAVDSSSDLYVQSSELAGVRKYDLAGSELGSPRDEEGAPSALALSASGELFVADEGGHILAYDAAGGQLSTFGAGVKSGQGLALDQSENALYALSQQVASVIPIPPPGPLVVGAGTETVLPVSATLIATINAEGSKASSYHFEYGTTAAYGSSTATTALAGAPFEDQGVSAGLSGLQPNTLYHFRVAVATGGTTTYGADQTFTTLPAVAIDSESVSRVSSFGARLEAELNPLGVTSEFHFEYGPSTAYGDVAPASDASAGSGTVDANVEIEVQNLSPGAVYHYRVVATNVLGTVVGPDQTFTTQSAEATSLIDGRGWEMVSPSEKHGATFEAMAKEGDTIEAAENGDAISYGAKTPITSEPEGNRSVAYSQVLSSRTAPGMWHSEDIATKHEEVSGFNLEPSEYRIFSPNLETAIVEPHGATPLSEAASERTIYRREANSTYTPLLTSADVRSGVKFGGEELDAGGFGNSASFVAATPDQSHVLLESPQGLTNGVEFVADDMLNLYEWNDGTLQLASVLPNRLPVTQEGKTASYEPSEYYVRHAISNDGSQVVFGTIGGETSLFVRNMVLEQTIRIDLPEAGIKHAVNNAPIFQTASSDGSHVFFLDRAKLTADSTATEQGDDLYECEVAAPGGKLGCTLKDLTVDPNPGESADVRGTVMGADESGTVLYFVANGRLAPGAVRGDCELTQTQSTQLCNLYEHDIATGTTRLIAVLSGDDSNDWFSDRDLGNVTSRVSSNGQYLAFMSDRPLTGFDNRDAVSGVPDEEVFEYSLAAQTLTCVSCASSGARPHGVLDPGSFPGLLVDRPDLWGERWLAASIPGWTKVNTSYALYQSRYLSNSGRMFFNSATPLVPSDGNGLEDVYEYEPTGSGTCTPVSGCIGLISSGQSGEESAFLDASGDGSDVFFLSSGRLTRTDTDNAYDVYDAHVCTTSSPCGTELAAAPPPCDTADGCRAASSPQPDIFGAPASQTFSGSGNVPTAAAKPAAKAKPLTRAQKLTAALKVCKRDKSKAKRKRCEASAHTKYGPVKKRAKASR